MEDSLALTSILHTLSKCDLQRDLLNIRNLTYEILTLSTSGVDVKPAIPVIAKLLAHPDAFVKRVAGELISIHAKENPNVTLLGINTMVQDCKDVNPVVRGISFRILGSLKMNAVSEVLSPSIVSGLADKNAYVRRSAVLASIGLNSMSSSSVVSGEIWDLLYHHIRDDDAATVAACLCALEEVCAEEKGIVMSVKLGQFLINSMNSFSPNVQRIVMQFLLKYSPKTKDQIFDHLNSLDSYLTQAECFAMTFTAFELFRHLTQSMPKAERKLASSAWASVKTNLARERSEEIVSAAIHYINAVNFSLENCSTDFNKFLCREDDSLYLTHHKISVLSKMITKENMSQIFSEYLSHARTMSVKDVKFLVKNISRIINERPDMSSASLDFLKDLLTTDKSEIIEEVTQILPSLDLHEDHQWEEILSLVEEKSYSMLSSEAKSSLLQLIKTHPSSFKTAANILDAMFLKMYTSHDRLMEEEQGRDYPRVCSGWSSFSKIQLLGAMVKVFLLRPGVVHPLLAKHLECCIKDPDFYVRDKALMYYGFLSSKAIHD